jgi:nucleoside-diphosphate-sugar epimerase
MKALVTGGGGFLGRAIVQQLLKAGYSVRTFSRNRHPQLERLDAEVRHGDITSPLAVIEACQDCDVVFHVAAKVGIWGRYRDYHNVNVCGTDNVIQACRAAGVSRLIYTSTPSVVFASGDIEEADETIPYPPKFKSPYPRSKAIAEADILAANDSRLATAALRPHLIWGPGDTHLIPAILSRGRQRRLFRIGSQSSLVDFTYIDNAAEAHVLTARKLWPGSEVAGKAFFITDGNPIPLWDFVNRVLKCAGLQPVNRSVHPKLAYAGAAFCEMLYRILALEKEPPLTRFLVDEMATAHWFDISLANRLLGYYPRISTEEGFERLSHWIRESSTDQKNRDASATTGLGGIPGGS